MDMDLILLNLDIIEPYYIIIIVILGFIGNTYSFIKFRSSKFKFQNSLLFFLVSVLIPVFAPLPNHSASFYLASLFLVDNCYLSSLFIVSLKHFKVDLFNTEIFFCKLTIYITYVFAFLSVWNIVALSIERLLLVYFPFRKLSAKKKKTNIIVMSVLCCFAFGLYSFALFTSDLKYIENEGDRCQPDDNWFRFVQSMSVVDSVITFIVPFIIVFLINFAILIKMYKFRQKRGETNNTFALNDVSSLAGKLTPGLPASESHLIRENMEQNSLYPSSDSMNLANSTTGTTGQDTKQVNNIKRKRVYWRMARVLLLISVSFLVLNSPVFILQICHFQRNDIFGAIFGTTTENNAAPVNQVTQHDPNIHTSLLVEMFERFAYYVYYLHFTVNFIIFDRLSIFKKNI